MRVIKFYHIAIRLIVVLTITTNYHAQETGSSLKESIAIIHKHNGETLRGIVHHNDAEKIIITSGNEQKITIPYSQIASIEFISTESLKNQTEFEEEHLNYTQNCFFPTGFTTKKGDFTGNVHYGLSGNAKIGITDNFELTAGTISFFSYFISLGYSKEIGKVVQFGVNGYGGFIFDFNQNDIMTGYCIIPRFSLGNKDRNVTMGLIGSIGSQIYVGANLGYESYFGGYVAIKNRFRERWVVSTELASINTANYNLAFMGNLTFNFMRNFYSSWSLGVLGLWQENPNNIQLINLPFLPLPYFGYMKRFN